jgi:4-amino-4-deoxy-L-arabinose transferase-like glycosyltransferase
MQRPIAWRAILPALVLAIFILRLTGPSELEGDAQNRNIGYVMDAVWQGHWLVQTDIQGRIMSKPPLHTWLVGAFAAVGGINRLTLSLTSALAVAGMSLLVFQAGRRRFGIAAGGLAGLAVVLAPMMSKHITLVRTDALFALATALAAFAAHRAWARGGGWTAFWFWAALATLIKGPLGLALAAMGLLAWFWERRSDPAMPRLRGTHWPGLALFLLLILGWLLPALYFYGRPLVEKMFFEELIGHATGVGRGGFPARNFPMPTFYFIVRFLPFSLFAGYGLWRVVRRPAADAGERRFERFLFCWVVGGLLLFSLASHHRGDLLLPLWPAAALLAGREMAELSGRIGKRRTVAAMLGLIGFFLGGAYWTFHVKAQRNAEVRYTLETAQAASALAASGLDVKRLYHLDTPVTLQLALGTFRVWIKEEEALRLADGPQAVLLAVESPEKFPRLFGPEGPELREVFRWPTSGRPSLRIYANATNAGKPEEGNRG